MHSECSGNGVYAQQGQGGLSHTHSSFQAHYGPLAPFWKCNSYGCSDILSSPCLTELLNQSFQITERAPVYTFSSRPAAKPNTCTPAFTNKTPSSVKTFIQRALGSAGTGFSLVFSYVFAELLHYVSKISLELCMLFMALCSFHLEFRLCCFPNKLLYLVVNTLYLVTAAKWLYICLQICILKCFLFIKIINKYIYLNM